MSSGLKPQEIGAYNFGDTAAAADFDPDSQGRGELCPGTHHFIIAPFDKEAVKFPAYELYAGQQTKWNGQPCVVNKILVRFRCIDGPCRNAITSDFVPVPAAGFPLPTGMQNQWGQFVKALGFDLPKGHLVPTEMVAESVAGRDPIALVVGRECMIKIVPQRDAAKAQKYNEDGSPQFGPDFFGYSRVGSVPASVTPSPRPTNGGAAHAYRQAAPTPVAAGTVADIDL